MSSSPTVAPGMQNPSSKVWRKVMIRQLLVAAFAAVALSACGAGVETDDSLGSAVQALSVDASLSASTQDPVPPPQHLPGELVLAFDAQGVPYFVLAQQLPAQNETVNPSKTQRSRTQAQNSNPGSERSSSQDPIPPKVNPDDRPGDGTNERSLTLKTL